MKTIPPILLIVILITVILFIIYYCNKSKCSSNLVPYVIKTKDGFSGTPISKLSQNKDFYSKHRRGTLKYLLGVYPMAKESFESLTDRELASFYNSLWFYYHCQGEYRDNDLGSLTNKRKDDTTWGPLPCDKKYPIPYTPQGVLYNFYTYQKFNVPRVISYSDPYKKWIQTEHSGSTRPGIMGTYKNRNARPSGIMWLPPRSIHRDVWYPNGLKNNKPLEPDMDDKWEITVGEKPKFSFPNKWYGGLGNYRYIEVTHSPSDTGDAINQSPWWWYNACPGSGMFLNLGKTLAVKNKISGVFELSKILSKQKEGKKLLKKWFNTINPYKITWGIVGLCGYNTNTKQEYCDFSKLACGYACDPVKIGYANAANIKFKKFYDETKKLGVDKNNNPTKDAIYKAIDVAISNKDYFLAHNAVNIIADEICFFLGINVGLDTLQFYEDPNPSDNYVFEIIDYRIPERMKQKAKNRDYSDFLYIADPDAGPWSEAAKNNKYKMEPIKQYLENAYKNEWISVRDPLDIYNEDKVQKCKGLKLEKICDGEHARMQYCSNVPIMNYWKCLYMGNEFNDNSCILDGDNPTC